jgi:BirA family biotin operon repressor/biotin-[acetyl-CoA-carboxylase] ligase
VELPRTRALVPALRVLDEATSTNDVLAQLAAGEVNGSTVVTFNQTAGRGRLGRVWVAPPGKTLAASVLLTPASTRGGLPPEVFGWLPLIAGAAMASSIDAMVGDGRTGLKWPNDVQVDGLKVCGILAELLPSGGVILGTGVNLLLTEDELPVPTATSLALLGVAGTAAELADRALSGYLGTLRELVDRLVAVDGNAVASGVHREVSEWCRTIGKQVRVELPGDSSRFGVAVGIDSTGCLLLRDQRDETVSAVAAGDVTHLRYE